MIRLTQARRSPLLPTSVALFALIGCSAQLFGDSDEGDSGRAGGDGEDVGTINGPGQVSQSLCASLPPGTLGTTPIRQLTRDEYRNTIRDLTGLDVNVSSYPQVVDDGFDNDVAVLSVDPELAAYLQQQAELLAEQLTGSTDALHTITGCENIDEDCAQSFIDTFGQRALRRPLSSQEQQSYRELYEWGASMGGSVRGLKVVVQAFLQDPFFIHRVESGTPGSVNDFELATRLSYFLWRTTPDEELYSAAANGELSNPSTLEQQTRRMLNDPRARQMVLDFHDQWLGYGAVTGAIKDPYIFPDFTTELMADLKTETEQLIDHVVWSGEASFSDLLSADYSFMNGRVAAHYGITGVDGDEFQRVDLSSTARRGYLTHASFLASQATADATHPILRGVYVRERILCQHLPPPPPTAPTTVPDVDYEKTRREQFDQITSAPECSSCHTIINPTGFLFENYDSVGAYRTTENGHTVDASAELVHAGELEGTYADAQEFTLAAAFSADAEMCAVQHWFAFANGRGIEKADACSLVQLQELFAAANGDVQELILQIVLSPAFSARIPQEAP